MAGDPYVIPDGMFDDVSNAQSWNLIVSCMCEGLKIPDLTTRHGLKKIHARFNDYHKRLDSAYSSARRCSNEKVMGGVVGIMAKMCADAILRDKLFQKGLLRKVMPLLAFDSTRHVALQALAMVTHHGGLQARQDIARQNSSLIKLLYDYPDDPKVAELVIMTVTHATEAVVSCEETPDPRLVKETSIRAVLEATVAALRKPISSYTLLTHALGLLVAPTQHCPAECKAVPAMLRLLAAFTRSSSIETRADAFSGILRIPINESEFEQTQFDPRRFVEIYQRGTPPHLSDILMDYGPEKAEVALTLSCTVEYQKAIMQAVQDRDMYALGKKLASIIQRTEFAIAEGGWQLDGPDGEMANEANMPGVPFTRWTDSLPLSAKALRAKGTPADLDAADIVEMKFFMIRGRLPEAIALGHKALARNRGLAYAYYIVSMGAEIEPGLRAVKKGLKCKNITDFVRNQMLWRAVNHAAQQGMVVLREAKEGTAQARAEGTAFLMSAWEDAKTYISEAPPDGRHMLAVLTWYVMLTIVVRGPELSEDLRELDPARRKMATAVQFMEYMGYPVARTQLNLAREILLRHYTDGAKEWGALVRRYDELEARAQASVSCCTEGDDDLAEWLEKIDMDDPDDENSIYMREHGGAHAHRHGVPKAKSEMTSYELYRCSWCGNPSAVLRKCAGCGKTKYCDSGCQKSHWTEHKADCKGRS
ncbi:uncharacterized protein TRAVEDRAFT_45581 [Trametes versicolor FP-101664 SS1]|uniref:uncharacterized protein n=1 Tax=Trametes versicolor (strain FP-101664) TaxID=717944 RepID=UPI0004621E88|nr:uncharacterized protein TRAVEDRAFT_45581 [Trametes versicolor FP-101664 SS1]EIW60332.1 hypothetical protein TRAVEDRAFT_45581 [Trametes versicolor FP-101664 SS1]